MRAVRQHAFGGPEVLVPEDVAVPEPLPTEVLVRVTAAGINPVDLKTRAGEGDADVVGEPPFVLGWDAAGVVERTGFGVTTLRPGDPVIGMPWFPRAAGAYAEYVTAPARQFAPAPSTVDAATAATVPLTALTAWQTVVDTAHAGGGMRVLVHGAAGGVGRFAVQFAMLDDATVIGTATSEQATELTALGVSQVVDHRHERFEEIVEPIDVVVDLVGTPDYGLRSVSVLTPGGLYVGVPDGVADPVRAAAEAKGVRTTDFLVEPDGTALAEIVRLIDAGRVQVPAPGATFALSDARTAHEQLEARAVRGKAVLIP